MPALVKVDKGVRYITGKKRTPDAMRNFRTFVRYLHRYFQGTTPEAMLARQLEAPAVLKLE